MSTVPPIDVIGGGFGQPATHLFTITPSDALTLQYVTRAIRVGGAGDLAVKTLGGQIEIVPSVLAGETVPIQAVKVYVTGTTATLLMGMA
jgi:hypothetical protein